MPETDLATLLAFLREHGQRASPEALREHLVTQGYDMTLVDQAVAAYQDELRERARQNTAAGLKDVFRWLIAVMTILTALGILVIGGCLAGIGLLSEGGKNLTSEAWAFLLGFVAVALLFIFLSIVTVRWARRRSGS
jgi:hypothetical protein